MECKNEKDGSTLILIPAGEFIMGSNDKGDEKPTHTVHLDDYYIGKYEVTNEQFTFFVNDTGYDAGDSWKKYAVFAGENHPVIYVSWNDAMAYCKWAGLRLPTEAEWEKAARGTDGRKYPWGDEWDASKLTYNDNRRKDDPSTQEVGSIPAGASPFGALDMSGNVWEWCSSLYRPYPYDTNDGRENNPAEGTRVVRGGSWRDFLVYRFRCANRLDYKPFFRFYNFGFRVAFTVKE